MSNAPEGLQPLLDSAVLGLFRAPPSGAKTAPSVFLTTLYTSLQIIWDDSIQTAATNGLKLWINPIFFRDHLNPLERVALLAHELWHVAFLHMERLADRCPDKWNQAADHAINLMLKEYGYAVGSSWLADPQFTGMSADQIYDLLDKNPGLCMPNPQAGDIVMPGDGEGGNDHEADGGMTQDQLKEVFANVVRAATMSKMSGDPPGSMPGDLETKIDSLLNPRLPWHVLLRRWFQEIGQPHFTWRTPNRRHLANDMYLPGLLNDDDGLSHILWACDSSGSVTDHQLKVMNSEIRGVQQRFNPERMTLMVFDTRVNTVEEFNREEAIPPMTFVGRGGTNLADLWEHTKKLKPKALVVFSDLECHIPPPIPGIPVLWVCLDNPTRKVPYGQVVHVDSR